MSLIPALRRERLGFKASLVYKVSFKTVRVTQRNPITRNQNNNYLDTESKTTYNMTKEEERPSHRMKTKRKDGE